MANPTGNAVADIAGIHLPRQAAARRVVKFGKTLNVYHLREVVMNGARIWTGTKASMTSQIRYKNQ